MAYEVTATRKRPHTLKDLSGQEFVVATLEKSISEDRIANAYLFAGPRGVGKTSSARILARALNCSTGSTPIPCGVCDNCKEIVQGRSMDVIEIDGASNTGVDDIRSIKDEVLFPPTSSKYKIYIIDEVHMLSNSAFNALLKTIEEPPPFIVFIFATTEAHKVPPTVRSRCQQFNFRLLSQQTIRDHLASAAEDIGIKAEESALLWIAREATGSLRDAYTLFDQVASFSEGEMTYEKIRDKLGLVGLDQMNTLATALANGDRSHAMQCYDLIFAAGVSTEQFCIDLADYLRSLLFIRNGVKRESILGHGAERYSSVVLEAWSVEQLEFALEGIFTLYRNLRYSLNSRFEVELFIERLATLKDYISPAEILKGIRVIREELKNGEIIPYDANMPEVRTQEDPVKTNTPITNSGHDYSSSDTESDNKIEMARRTFDGEIVGEKRNEL